MYIRKYTTASISTVLWKCLIYNDYWTICAYVYAHFFIYIDILEGTNKQVELN